jgi:cyanophycinase-like exopeptidase
MKKPILFIFLSFYSALTFAFPKEMVLAGGAMKLCTSTSEAACKNSTKAFADARKTSHYQIKESDISTILNPGFWSGRTGAPSINDLRAMLTAARKKALGDIYSAGKLEDILADVCVDNAKVINCSRKAAKNIWHTLLDEERSFILSAFEIPEFANGKRRREIANINDSKNPHGLAILKTFVEAAAKRSPGKRPRILFVTASSADPYDAVDFYVSALKQAGADPVWWPIDQAMSVAVNGKYSCDDLPKLRIEKLSLADREQVFPDLVAAQKLACENPRALAAFPSEAQGIFFSGGDQWRLRQAFFDENDQANVWLLNLRAAFSRGEIVVGGTSAGTAVQSGIAMPSNGTSDNAVSRSAKIGAPIEAGCERAKRCPAGWQEDDLSYWPKGGLALIDGLVFDTHFSERARELRLLRLLHQAEAKLGIGVDETSAVHLTWLPDRLEMEALGASGAWFFNTHNSVHSDKKISAHASYLAPGRILRWKNNSLQLIGEAKKIDRDGASENMTINNALQDTALRTAAWQMSSTMTDKSLAGNSNLPVSLSLTPESQTWTGPQGQIGISNLILELSDFEK